MSFDFNRQGVRYNFVAARGPREDYGLLPDRPLRLLENLRALLAAEYPNADASRQRWLLDAAGCLDRLKAFLLQVWRVAQHAEVLTRGPLPGQPLNAQPGPGNMVLLAADEACFDFESLLFHARAALDRVTLFVTRMHNQSSDRFSKLRRKLKDFSERDQRAQRMTEILDTADRFGGLLTDQGSSKALRSLVAHRSSVPEGRQIAFTIHFLPDGRRLIFDCEALGQPLFQTAQQLSEDVPFVVLNALAIYIGHDMLSHDEFRVLWKNPTTVFSRHIDADGRGPVFSVGSVFPSGFTVRTHSLVPAVLEEAVACDEVYRTRFPGHHDDLITPPS